MTIERRVERMFNPGGSTPVGTGFPLVPFASLPAASTVEGQIRIVSDIGDPPGTEFMSDGMQWKPSGGLRPRIGYSDDFKRPDTALGSLGGGWTLFGNGVSQTRVLGGKYILPQTDPVTTRTVYASRSLPFSPTYLCAKFNWKDNGVSTSGNGKTIALILSAEAITEVTESLHVTLTPYGSNGQLATQVILRGPPVVFIDVVPLTNVSSQQVLTDGTTHKLEIFNFGGKLVIVVLDGVTVSTADVTAYTGNIVPATHLIVEHYSASGVDIQYELEVNEILSGHAC